MIHVIVSIVLYNYICASRAFQVINYIFYLNISFWLELHQSLGRFM